MRIEINKNDVFPSFWQQLLHQVILPGQNLGTVSSITVDINLISFSQRIPALKLETTLNRKPNWSINQIVEALPDYEDLIREKLKRKPNWTATEVLIALS